MLATGRTGHVCTGGDGVVAMRWGCRDAMAGLSPAPVKPGQFATACVAARPLTWAARPGCMVCCTPLLRLWVGRD